MTTNQTRSAIAAACLTPAILLAGSGVSSALPGPITTELKSTLRYTLTAKGFPASIINISYIGDDGRVVDENKVFVGAGYSWTRTARAPIGTYPTLKVSVESAGLAGIALSCTATSTPILNLANTPKPIVRSGTIEFAGGFSQAVAKTCG
ncbi:MULTISPECIES: hypothetical protein [Tsukamurella]|uniref:Uncharacterized protein n=2 Tax=Tsukamurella TaxID=2060 RepID=A0A846X689_9ACTN|nr:MULTISPECIES: hypothetical protein [Tsukamurella]KXP06709.1 hypothetical protein AXK60_11625 [Tsukamurella pseudospumae]NKY19829.1 hypothetical protein [Tsukamurella spumae]